MENSKEAFHKGAARAQGSARSAERSDVRPLLPQGAVHGAPMPTMRAQAQPSTTGQAVSASRAAAGAIKPVPAVPNGASISPKPIAKNGDVRVDGHSAGSKLVAPASNGDSSNGDYRRVASSGLTGSVR